MQAVSDGSFRIVYVAKGERRGMRERLLFRT